LKYCGKPVKDVPTTFLLRYTNFCLSHSNVLNSENINMDEYYLKNDLLNYVDSIIYDENSTKRIDRLLLFRLDLNTHSTTVRIKNKLLIIRNYKLEQKKKILPKKTVFYTYQLNIIYVYANVLFLMTYKL